MGGVRTPESALLADRVVGCGGKWNWDIATMKTATCLKSHNPWENGKRIKGSDKE
jgi:hypothetical protein